MCKSVGNRDNFPRMGNSKGNSMGNWDDCQSVGKGLSYWDDCPVWIRM